MDPNNTIQTPSQSQPIQTPAQGFQPPPVPSQPAQTPPPVMPPQQGGRFKKIFAKTGGLPIIPILVVFTLLSILIVITLSFLTVYTPLKIPLFNSYNKELNLFFYHIPLFPKTSEQILLNAVDKNAKISSYNPDFSLTAQLGSSTIEAAGLDLVIKGPIDLNEEKGLQFDAQAQGAVNYLGKTYKASFNVRQVNKKLYARVESISDEILSFVSAMAGSYAAPGTTTKPNTEIETNLKKVFENWIAYENPGIESEARRELEKNTSEKSIIDAARKNAQDFLLKTSVLPDVKKMKDEEVEGVKSYHLVFKPSKESLRTIYKEYSKTDVDLDNPTTKDEFEEIINGIDSLEMSIWIGKKDAILRKSSVQMSMNLDFLNKMGQNSYGAPSPYLGYTSQLGINPKLSLSTVLVLKDVNEKFEFKAPEKVITAEEFMTQLSNAFKTKEQIELEAKRSAIDKDLTTINEAMTKYYVAKSAYPISLNELSTGGYLTDAGVIAKLGTYTYRKGTRYVAVFTVFSMPNPYNYGGTPSPYYGFTSDYNYNRSLTLDDLSRL